MATVLEELGIAGGHRFRVDMGTIPVFSETRKIGQLFGINPLGLIGSGSSEIIKYGIMLKY
jgi:hydrogenase maturation factor